MNRTRIKQNAEKPNKKAASVINWDSTRYETKRNITWAEEENYESSVIMTLQQMTLTT
jgi:hypothetical protein